MRFVFIAYFEVISFARAGAEACPYAEDLDRVARFEIHPGTKKTTHALHRRFAFTSSLSTADVSRLPNLAGFRIRDAFGMWRQNNKSSHSSNQNHTFS